MKKFSKSQLRQGAREAAMQVLYQWHFNHLPRHELIYQFKQDHDVSSIDLNYFETLVVGVIGQVVEIDAEFQPFLVNRDLNELDPIALATLRYATFELLHRLDIPFKVVLNEALKVVRSFGAEESFKFVNAVLDQVAQKVRAVEKSNNTTIRGQHSG